MQAHFINPNPSLFERLLHSDFCIPRCDKISVSSFSLWSQNSCEAWACSIIIILTAWQELQKRESDSPKSVCCHRARRTRDKELLINDVSALGAAKRPYIVWLSLISRRADCRCMNFAREPLYTFAVADSFVQVPRRILVRCQLQLLNIKWNTFWDTSCHRTRGRNAQRSDYKKRARSELAGSSGGSLLRHRVVLSRCWLREHFEFQMQRVSLRLRVCNSALGSASQPPTQIAHIWNNYSTTSGDTWEHILAAAHCLLRFLRASAAKGRWKSMCRVNYWLLQLVTTVFLTLCIFSQWGMHYSYCSLFPCFLLRV